MKHLYLLVITLILCSCGNERILQLPEIENASVTEIHDVSHAYLFYDETLPDSVELNRKNLIITTNWLVNVDKRLTLEQAIPKIKFLQDKKRNADMHKNEAAKNYFTCSDTSIQNLGFLEFTDVIYKKTPPELNNNALESNIQKLNINFKNANEVYINKIKTNALELSNSIKERIILSSDAVFLITLSIDKSNTFQNYITLKNTIEPFLYEFVTLDDNECIY